MKSRISLLLVLLTLGACGSMSEVPQDRYYRLSVTPAGPVALVDGTVVVSRFQSDGLYANRALVYSEDSQHAVLQQYNYHFWMESPETLLQTALIDWLQQTNAAKWVLSRREGRPDLTISPAIHRFEHLRAGDDSVIVEIAFTVRAKSRKQPVLIKKYSARVAVDGSGMSAVVVAFGQGVDQVFAGFMQELGLALASGG